VLQRRLQTNKQLDQQTNTRPPAPKPSGFRPASLWLKARRS
jgi:hypothetical protein